MRRIYAEFFAALDQADWDRPVKRGRGEWTLHETVAHLCALNGDGLASVQGAQHHHDPHRRLSLSPDSRTGRPPLWTQLSPELRHRAIARVMRALSLLYRFDIGGPLRTTFAFRVDGPGGGEWFVNVAPGVAMSGEGGVEHPGLAIHLRATEVFCRMFTGRLNLPWDLLRGEIKLRGNLRLFAVPGRSSMRKGKAARQYRAR